jgi:hypothetical protein
MLWMMGVERVTRRRRMKAARQRSGVSHEKKNIFARRALEGRDTWRGRESAGAEEDACGGRAL